MAIFQSYYGTSQYKGKIVHVIITVIVVVKLIISVI